MQFDYPLLEALAAVVREGTFDGAAQSLGISSLTIGERIRLLEETTGAVLLIRDRQCIPTQFGQQLCRHLDQVQLMEEDLRRSFASVDRLDTDGPSVIRVAVNADSLATWFPEVVRSAGSKLKLHFEVIPDDQEHTAERLRDGEVLAAITSETDTLPGCRRIDLGSIEYIAVASESFLDGRLAGEVSAESLSAATYVVFDRKDTLPLQWLMKAFGRPARLRGHWIPSFSGYLACCLNGSGWGMMPRHSVGDYLLDGSLRELVPGTSIMVPLHWQSIAPNSEIMTALSSIVMQVAGQHLEPPELARRDAV